MAQPYRHGYERLCFWKRAWAALWMLWHQLRLPVVVRYYADPNKPKAVLFSENQLHNYTLQVYVKTSYFQCDYRAPWASTKWFRSFQIYSVAGGAAPKSLKKACEKVVTMPTFLHPWVDVELQMQTAVDAYLDLLGQDLAVFDPTEKTFD